MPKQRARMCPYCRRLVRGGPCPCRIEHARQYDRDRGPDRQFYSMSRWRKFRRWFLGRHPLCVDCEAESRTKMATVVDEKRILRTDNGDSTPESATVRDPEGDDSFVFLNLTY